MANIYFQRVARALIVLSAIVLSNQAFSQARGVGDGAKPEVEAAIREEAGTDAGRKTKVGVEAAAKKEAGKGTKQDARKQARKEARKQALNR